MVFKHLPVFYLICYSNPSHIKDLNREMVQVFKIWYNANKHFFPIARLEPIANRLFRAYREHKWDVVQECFCDMA